MTAPDFEDNRYERTTPRMPPSAAASARCSLSSRLCGRTTGCRRPVSMWP